MVWGFFPSKNEGSRTLSLKGLHDYDHHHIVASPPGSGTALCTQSALHIFE